MPFTIIRQDITKMQVDAIVNAANTDLLMGGGVCGAIFRAAGERELQAACDLLSPIQTGEAVITPGFSLPAKFVIHTAGPVYQKQNAKQSEALLYAAYGNSLRLAKENGCESIAFPLISSGIYGYPKDEALHVATRAISDFLTGNEMNVYLAVFDRAAFVVGKALLGKVESYIDEHYVEEHHLPRGALLTAERRAFEEADECHSIPIAAAAPQAYNAPCMASIDEQIQNLDEPFSTTLFRLIDGKGKTDVEVYKRANIDRKLFSKIRTGKAYLPGKRTVIALAIALELNLRQTDDLLERAGYALSHSQKSDVIVEYFIVNQHYDIFEINEVLFKYDQPLLGG